MTAPTEEEWGLGGAVHDVIVEPPVLYALNVRCVGLIPGDSATTCVGACVDDNLRHQYSPTTFQQSRDELPRGAQMRDQVVGCESRASRQGRNT